MGNVCKAQFTFGDALVNRCWDCVGRRWVYVSELEPNLKLLKVSVDELGSLRNDVMTRISLAERRGMKCLDQVQWWLSRVDLEIENVNSLLEKRQLELAKLCIGGCCSTNYVSSYKFGKKMVKRLKEVHDLVIQAKEFKEVATLTLPEPKNEIPCEPTVGLEQKFDSVCSYLLEQHVGIVGLYGKGGVGKTQLLMQLNNWACSETSCFDLVIWVAVSKHLKIGSIQNHIGKKIGFSEEGWMRQSLSEKAVDIFNVLKWKKFVLLLDDVWEPVNLTHIGVPLRTPFVSKIVFTTQLEIICFQMRAHKHVKVEPLGPEESWILFTDIMGQDTFKANPEISTFAIGLVEECGGVAQEIVKLAHTVACKRTSSDWYDAFKVLGSSSQDEIVENRPIIEDQEDDEDDEVEAAATVLGSPITDKTLMRMAGYVSGRRITARNRAVKAINREKEAGQDSKVREYVKRLRMEYNGDATIGLFYNATGCTVKICGHRDWNGHLSEGLHPLKVDNGQWGVFVHTHDDSMSGRRGSRGAIVYGGENCYGRGRDWMLAWDNPSAGNKGGAKVFTEVREKDHFSECWDTIYKLLSKSGRQHRDVWGEAVSSITLEDTDGPFFRATLSLDNVIVEDQD